MERIAGHNFQQTKIKNILPSAEKWIFRRFSSLKLPTTFETVNLSSMHASHPTHAAARAHTIVGVGGVGNAALIVSLAKK